MDSLKYFWDAIVSSPVFLGFLGIFCLLLVLSLLESRKGKNKAKKINENAFNSTNIDMKNDNAINLALQNDNDDIKKIWTYIFIIIIAFLIMVILGCTVLGFVGIIFGIIILIVGNLVIMFLYEKYAIKFKENVVTKVINKYNREYKYYPMEGISQSEYLECSFKETVDKYFSTDLIKDENGDFCYCNVLTYVQDVGGAEEKHTSAETFSGSFAKTNIKNIGCKIFMGSVKTNLLGSKNYNKLTCENEEFNKLFNPYTDNEKIAHQVLTKDVMNKLVAIKKELSFNLDIRLINDKLYIRFLSINGFKPSIFPKVQKKNLYSSMAIVAMSKDILDDIKKCFN